MSLTKNMDIVSEAATLIYQMNNEELNEIVRTIRLKQKHISEQAVLKFRIGDIVQFDSSKLNRIVIGKITKVNRKTIHVDTVDAGKWRVSPTMLSKSSDSLVA